MTFSKKLQMIMTIMDCNNSKLGKGINIDPSLISRWRSGERRIKPNSPYIPLIVDFLLSVEPMPYQIDAFNNILGTQIQLKKYNDIFALKKVITAWLSDPDEDFVKNMEFSNELSPITLSGLMNKLSNISAVNNTAINNTVLNTPVLSYDTNTGRQVPISIYTGVEGKRDAVLRIMDTLISIDNPAELLCFSDESIEWLIGDRSFFLVWASLMKTAVLKGHKIKIIHIVNRSPNEVMAAIDQWAPLHLTGKLESYYMPKYVANKIKKTFWVIPGVLASGAITASPKGLCENTYITQDEEIVKNMHDTFEGLLSQCRPYFKIYSVSSCKGYFSALMEFDATMGNAITLKDTLTSITLPENVLIRMLDRSDLSIRQKNQQIELHRYRVESFIKALSRFKITDILSIDALFDITSTKFTTLEGLDQFPVSYEPQDLFEHIMSIVTYLKEYDNYEFIPARKDIFNFGDNILLTAKDGIGAILAKWNQNSSDTIVVMTHEDFSSTVFYNLLNTHVNKIPYEQRDRSYVIPRLEAYAQRLLNK
ncbi:MAG: hypothetical protein AB7G87_07745 [Clostridia bacterium]